MSRKKPDKKKGNAPQTPRPQEGEEQPKGFRQSWEYRSARFVLRIAAVLIFLGYLGFTTKSAATWVHTKWVRAQSLERLPRLADHYLNKVFKPHKLYTWVSMRHPRDTEEIIERLEPFTGRLSTFTFIYYALQLQQKDKLKEAMFWWQFARYRARFDALRCGSSEAVDNLGELLELIPHPQFPPELSPESPAVVGTVIDALDLDARYPAENIPEDLCDALRALEPGKYVSVPVPRWRDIRFTLRRMTEYRIHQMEEKTGIEYQGTMPAPQEDDKNKTAPGAEDEQDKDCAEEKPDESKKSPDEKKSTPCKDREAGRDTEDRDAAPEDSGEDKKDGDAP